MTVLLLSPRGESAQPAKHGEQYTKGRSWTTQPVYEALWLLLCYDDRAASNRELLSVLQPSRHLVVNDQLVHEPLDCCTRAVSFFLPRSFSTGSVFCILHGVLASACPIWTPFQLTIC